MTLVFMVISMLEGIVMIIMKFEKYVEIPQNNSFFINRKERRWFWVPAVLISIAAGVFFLVINLIDYMNSTTVTNIQSSTSSLNNIYYPSVTVCNTNQIR